MLRCIKLSPDAKHIACGDWTGNIRIYELSNFNETQCIQAHDEDIICLDYSPIIQSVDPSNKDSYTRYWLASGSRDRLT